VTLKLQYVAPWPVIAPAKQLTIDCFLWYYPALHALLLTCYDSRFIAEMARLVAPGGTVIMTDFCRK
jgi:hypothetical protein